MLQTVVRLPHLPKPQARRLLSCLRTPLLLLLQQLPTLLTEVQRTPAVQAAAADAAVCWRPSHRCLQVCGTFSLDSAASRRTGFAPTLLQAVVLREQQQQLLLHRLVWMKTALPLSMATRVMMPQCHWTSMPVPPLSCRQPPPLLAA